MTYQFNIQIKGTREPLVWRQLRVPGFITLDIFHRVIQEAFGWYDEHLYQFSKKGLEDMLAYKVPDEYDGTNGDIVKDSREMRVCDVFTQTGQTMTYLYDFGDSWHHLVKLENVSGDVLSRAECIGGAGKCPPEDCGGVHGYQELLAILADEEHPEYEGIKEWLGLEADEQWDSQAFDLNKTNERLRLTPLKAEAYPWDKAQ
jgi:hypothetical protein